jgi:predicted dehydrogenase
VSLWMGINRGDRYASMVSMDTGNKGLQAYAREHFGKDHPAAKSGFFQKGDTTITLLRSVNEKLVAVRYESGSTRPFGEWESLNGTKGSYDGSPGSEMIYLEGRSPHDKWEPLAKYRDPYEHSYWRKDGQLASSAGHGGGDFFVLREFYRAIAEDREPPIDVYDGATWSALLPLSARSIRESNRSLEMPDFTRGKWKNRKFEGFGIAAA